MSRYEVRFLPLDAENIPLKDRPTAIICVIE